MLQRYLHPNPEHDAAMVAVTTTDPPEIMGVARYFQMPHTQECEFAIAVSENHRDQGIGSALMRALMDVGRKQGMRRILGWVLSDNLRMLNMMKHLGFKIRAYPEDPSYRLCSRDLT
jgi:acetyltransferase